MVFGIRFLHQDHEKKQKNDEAGLSGSKKGINAGIAKNFVQG